MAFPSTECSTQMGQTLADIQTGDLGFLSLAAGSKLQILPTPWPMDNLPPPTASLMSIASTKRLLAAAGPDVIVLAATDLIRKTFEGMASSKDSFQRFEPQLMIPMSIRISQVIFSSNEKYLILSAETGGGLAVYEVQSILNGLQQSAFELSTNGQALRAIVPNPSTDKGDLLAVVTVEGNLMIANLSERAFISGAQGPVLKDSVSCISWSARGKQLVAGLGDGTAYQMTPEGEAKSLIPRPPAIDVNNYVSSIIWLENHLFIIIHTSPFEANRSPSSSFHLVTRTTDYKNYLFQKIPDPALPYGLNRYPPHHFMLRLRDFPPNLQDMIIVASTASSDIGLITRSKVPLANNKPTEMTTNVFTMTEMADDSQRAQLPVSVQSGDTSPIGLSLDLSSHSKVLMPIPGDEVVESSTPVPALMVLNNEGFMASWWVIYSESIRRNTIYPGLVAAASIPSSPFGGGATVKQTTENTNFDKSTSISGLGASRSIPTFGSPTPLGSGSAFGTTSTFGSSSQRWGTASAPRAFNTTPVFGQPAFETSNNTQALKPGFAAPVFGQTSTPLGMHKSSWETQSNSASNSAFGNTDGTNKPVPIFGSQTNIGLNGFASLASGVTQSVFKSQPSTESSPFYHESPSRTIGSTSTTSFSFKTPQDFSLGTTFKADHSSMNDENQIEPIRPIEQPRNLFMTVRKTIPSSGIEDITLNDVQAGTSKKNNTDDLLDSQKQIPLASTALKSSNHVTEKVNIFDTNSTNVNPVQSRTSEANTGDVESETQPPGVSKEKEDSEFLSIEDSIKVLSGTSLGNEKEMFKDQNNYFELLNDSEFKEENLSRQPNQDHNGVKVNDKDGESVEDKENEEFEEFEEYEEDEEDEEDEEERRLEEKKVKVLDSTQNPDVLGQGEKTKNSSNGPSLISKVNCVEKITENDTNKSNDTVEAFKSENSIRSKDLLDKIDSSSSRNETASPSPSLDRDASFDNPKQLEPLRTARDLGDLSPSSTLKIPDKGSMKLVETSMSNLLKQKDDQDQMFAVTLAARRDAENLQAELTAQRKSNEKRCREVAAKIKAEEKLHLELVARREAEERRRNEVIAQRKTEEKRRNELKAIWEAEELQREELRARKEAEEKQALVDSDDVSMQKYFASALEPTTRLNDFVAHSDYVSITTEDNIPAQVETVYRDINSMIDTLGINSRSLNEFILGHTNMCKLGGRSEEDLRDDSNWVLGEITTLSSIVENNLSRELESGRIRNIDNKLEICREIQKDLMKLRVKHNDIKKIIATSKDPNYLAVARVQPLGLKQAAQQHDLRQSFMKFQRLLSEAEESLAILKAKIVSRTIINKKYSGSTGPTVETVMKTITKLTNMAEKRSGDVDVLEDLMRKTRLNASPSTGCQEIARSPFRNIISPWNPRASNIRENLTPERSRVSLNQNLLSSSTGSSSRGSIPHKKLSGYTSEETAQLRYKLDRKKEMRNKLRLALQNTGVKVRVMDRTI